MGLPNNSNCSFFNLNMALLLVEFPKIYFYTALMKLKSHDNHSRCREIYQVQTMHDLIEYTVHFYEVSISIHHHYYELEYASAQKMDNTYFLHRMII